MKQYSDQAHCYDDLNGENSNAGTTNGGNQFADGVKSGSGPSGKGSASSMTVDAAKAERGGE